MIQIGNDKQGNAGRILAAAARIAKGAATGGPAGAAAGAVVSFLPEILKAGAIIIILILLIPLLVFVGIPHTVFGYISAGFEDIISLTDRAGYIDSIYREVDDYTQEYIDSIVEQQKNENEDGYDEVDVESDVDNTNIYWFISINAVAYKQDLYEMDEPSIKELLSQKLSFTAVIELVEDLVLSDSGDEETVTIRTLKVNVKDMEPEELMDKLEFTDEEKDWARLLHQTLESDGNTGRGYTGGYTIPPEALSDERFAAMITEAEKYLGYPYVWGGSSPSTSFDCSGFVSWVINHSGWNFGRLGSDSLWAVCTPVHPSEAKPGDLIFFEKTYDTPLTSHVGIYVGEGMMIHCGDPISYTSIETSYWQSHFFGYGRLPDY